MSTKNWTASACTGEAPANSIPTNAPGSVTETYGPGLVEGGQQGVGGGGAGDLEPGVAVQEAQRRTGLDLAVPLGEFVKCAPSGEHGCGECAADEDSGHGHDRDTGNGQQTGEDEAGHDGCHRSRKRHGRPPPGAVGGDPPPGRAGCHDEHEEEEAEQGRGVPDGPDNHQGQHSQLRPCARHGYLAGPPVGAIR